MIFLVGCEHSLQIGAYLGSTPEAPDLLDPIVADQVRWQVVQWIHSHGIHVVAEEMSREAIEARGVASNDTPVSIACQSTNTRHELLDLNSAERGILAAACAKKVPVNGGFRELVWANRLSDFTGMNVLMLCGSMHVTSLATTLLTYDDFEPIGVTILSREWRPPGSRSRFTPIASA